MSTEESKTTENTTTAKALPQPTAADIFFRNIAALCQVNGVQAFTFAVAMPRENGTSAVLSISAGPAQATQEWKDEVAKLLAENAANSAATIAKPSTVEPSKEPEVV